MYVQIMVPILSLAVYHIFAYLAKHYSNTALWQKYGASANAWLNSRQVIYSPSACPASEWTNDGFADFEPDQLLVLSILY